MGAAINAVGNDAPDLSGGEARRAVVSQLMVKLGGSKADTTQRASHPFIIHARQTRYEERVELLCFEVGNSRSD
jgi:hypothetical protein